MSPLAEGISKTQPSAEKARIAVITKWYCSVSYQVNQEKMFPNTSRYRPRYLAPLCFIESNCGI